MLLITCVTSMLLWRISSCYYSVDDNTCTVPTETCGPITPSVPNNYYAWLEVTNLLHNSTYYIDTFYDLRSQKTAKIHTLYDAAVQHVIRDYIHDVSITMIRWSDNSNAPYCRVEKISETTPWLVGSVGEDNKTQLIEFPSESLLFGGNFKYSYVNESDVRSILCNEWETCILDDQYSASFAVNYFWSDPKKFTSMYIGSAERPIAMSMKGSYQIDGFNLDINNNYNFVMIDSIPDFSQHKAIFEIPSNMYCQNLPQLKPPPTRMSAHVSLRLETIVYYSNSETAYVMNMQEWHDEYNEVVRQDYIPVDQESEEYKIAGKNHITVIQDFMMKIEYVINNSQGNCSIINIPKTDGDVTVGSNGYIHITDPIHLLGLGNNTNVTYYGKKTARGLECDVWVGYVDYKINGSAGEDKYMYETYILDDDWKDDSGNGRVNFTIYEPRSLPVLMKIQEDITSQTTQNHLDIKIFRNIYKFEDLDYRMGVYDITPCFTAEEKRRFRISFPREFRHYLDVKPSEMYKEVQQTMAVNAQVPDIRIQKINIEFSEEEGVIFTEFTIVDIPLIGGTVKPHGWVGLPLDKAVEKLKENQNTMIVYLRPLNNSYTDIKMHAINDSLVELDENNCGTKPTAVFNDLPQRISIEESNDFVQHLRMTKRLIQNAHEIYSERDVRDCKITQDAIANEFKTRYTEDNTNIVNVLSTGTSQTYDSGSMAGMGIGMFLVGLVIGVLVMSYGLSKLGIKPQVDTIPLTVRTPSNKTS